MPNVTARPKSTQVKLEYIPYSVNAAAYNNAQSTITESAPRILASLCETLKDRTLHPYATGRRPYPLKEMVFELGLRSMRYTSLRKSIGEINTCDPELQIYHRTNGHYSTMSNCIRDPALTPILKELILTSSLPFSRYSRYFAIDATGFSSSAKMPWSEAKKNYKKNAVHSIWRKLHLCVDVKYKIITAAAVSPGKDNELFRSMLETTDKFFTVEEVCADKMYCTRENYNFTRKLGIEAFLDFKSNATGKSKCSPEYRTKFKLRRDNPIEFKSHYNRRPNIENEIWGIKALLFHTIRSKDPVAQENEILLKVLNYNIAILHHASHHYHIDIDFRGLSERDASQINNQQQQIALQVPQPSEPQEGNGVAIHQETKRRRRQPRRRCSDCDTIYTDKSWKGSDFWHHWKGGKSGTVISASCVFI